LVGGLGHAAAHLFGTVLRTGLQPTLQLAGRRRQDEDADQVLSCSLLELLGTLPINVEQYISTGAQSRFHRLAWGSVVVAENLRPFEQLAPVDSEIEVRGFNEMIVDARHLTRPLRAGGD